MVQQVPGNPDSGGRANENRHLVDVRGKYYQILHILWPIRTGGNDRAFAVILISCSLTAYISISIYSCSARPQSREPSVSLSSCRWSDVHPVHASSGTRYITTHEQTPFIASYVPPVGQRVMPLKTTSCTRTSVTPTGGTAIRPGRGTHWNVAKSNARRLTALTTFV